MAKSGRTPAPRTLRHGYSRAPLSAACRTVDSFGPTRLPILHHQAAPAPARAPLHAADPSDRPRSDPDHAAARHDRGGKGVRASPWRLDRRPSWPSTEGSTVPARHSGAVARHAASPGSPRRRARHGLDRDARQRREDSLRRRRRRTYGSPRARLPQARGAQGSAEGGAALRRGTRRAGAADLDPRPIQPLGLLHHGRFAVVLVAADPRAALRARLPRGARSRASRRDESLGAVLAG